MLNKKKHQPYIFLTEKLAKDLAKSFGTPLLVLSKDQLIENYKNFKDLMPKIDIFYAIKANPQKIILETLNDIGSSFEVASGNEIIMLKQLGIDSQKIIFANTVKKEADLLTAKKFKVDQLAFDNLEELEKIAKVYPKSKVFLRTKVPNEKSIVDLSLKFGAEPDFAIDLLKKALSLGLKPIGLSFHVGSQCLSIKNYELGIIIAKEIFKKAKKLKIDLNFLDLGGGFPIKYLDTDDVPDIEAIAKIINYELFDFANDFPEVKIVAEPGRFIIGSAVNLITSVIGKNSKKDKIWYTIDDGIYGSFSGIIFDFANYSFKSFKKNNIKDCIIAGPSCDSLDIVKRDCKLAELDRGDILVVPSMGAYTSAHATDFNGIERAKFIAI